jgi:hypothetical protein
MYRWKVGLVPAEPSYRRALAAERKARRRNRAITAGLPRLERRALAAIFPLAVGPALIAILLLSLGL